MEREIIDTSRILIVDDQDANVLLIERLLQHAGYKHYLSLTDSRELLTQFRLFKPDLILLDLMMPKFDGYAAMRQLSGWLPSTAYLPILVITADTSRVARQKALALGAKDFLTKPIDAAEATLRIYNLLLTRWLYCRMDGRSRRWAELAGLSAARIAEARQELEQLMAAAPLLPAQWSGLQTALNGASETIAELVSDKETPAPSLVERAG